MTSRTAPAGAQLPPPLVMRFGAFGDAVLLTVLLRQLHARFGQPVDVISSGDWTEQLLAGLPAVGRLFVIRSRRTPYWLSLDQQRLAAWLRKRGPGATWYSTFFPIWIPLSFFPHRESGSNPRTTQRCQG